MRDGVRTEWADFFDGHAPEYDSMRDARITTAIVARST
jgi:hypothetical protein